MDELKVTDKRGTKESAEEKPEPVHIGWMIDLNLRSQNIVRMFYPGKEDAGLVTQVLLQRIVRQDVVQVTTIDVDNGVHGSIIVNFAAVDWFRPPTRVYK